jgi:hypothetical protein
VDRAFASGAKGRRFDSYRAYFQFGLRPQVRLLSRVFAFSDIMRKFHFIICALICALGLQTLPSIHAQRQTRNRQSTTRSTGTLSAQARRAAGRILSAQLRRDLYFVASDEMGGRNTPSPGLDATARFLAERLQRAGLRPAGDDGTFLQRIALRRYQIDADATRSSFMNRPLRFGEEFVTNFSSNGSAQGNLVFVGNGWVVQSKNINAYAGVDVRDKIVIVAGGARPEGVTDADTPRAGHGTTWDDPASFARRNGARGLIIIPRTRDFEAWWRGRRRALTSGVPQLESASALGGAGSSLPTITLSSAMLNQIFEGERMSGAEAMRAANEGANTAMPAFDLAPAKTLDFTVRSTSTQETTQNVVAVLEGSDPVLRNEYVAIGSHYDHVGTGAPVNGDAIYNGADDDGSGTVAMLAMAEAFARERVRPRRSILFVWHAGEEKGLWGSRFFTENPTVPLQSIIAQLNIDMIGRSRAPGDTDPRNSELTGPNEIYLIGSRMMSTELGDLSERVNRAYLNLSFNYLYDAPDDPNRFFFRSDHYNYAVRGIPVIFYFNGVHADYHRPSDSPDKIDYMKLERVTRTIFMTAWELANLAARPRVDRQLPSQLSGS